MSLIKLAFKDNARDWAKWLALVPEKTQLEIERQFPAIRQQTKSEVKKHLTRKHGVDKGIYKKSFKINNFAQSRWEIGFQVYARKPHYRLTHLLEGKDNRPGGHKIYLFRSGRGKPTAKGNIGMDWYKTRLHPSGYTDKVIHIEPGQDYAEKKVFELYQEAPTKVLTERTKKL